MNPELLVLILTLAEKLPALYREVRAASEQKGELTPEQAVLLDSRAEQLFTADQWQVKE